MQRLWFEGGAGGSGEAPGDDGQNPSAVETPEGSSGADEGAAVTDADAERQRYIAEMVQKGIEAALPNIMARLQPAPAAPATNPPTASRGVVADMEREASEIAAEQARLRSAMETQGYTAANIVANSNLAMRVSNFNARLLAHGMQIQEQERQVDGIARGDDKVKEAAWKKFASENPGIPVAFVRAKFEQDYAAANPQQPKRGSEALKEPARPVNVSGGGGSGISAPKTRTVTQATYNAELEAAEDRGDMATVVKMGRDRRSGALQVKG